MRLRPGFLCRVCWSQLSQAHGSQGLTFRECCVPHMGSLKLTIDGKGIYTKAIGNDCVKHSSPTPELVVKHHACGCLWPWNTVGQRSSGIYLKCGLRNFLLSWEGRDFSTAVTAINRGAETMCWPQTFTVMSPTSISARCWYSGEGQFNSWEWGDSKQLFGWEEEEEWTEGTVTLHASHLVKAPCQKTCNIGSSA